MTNLRHPEQGLKYRYFVAHNGARIKSKTSARRSAVAIVLRVSFMSPCQPFEAGPTCVANDLYPALSETSTLNS